MDCDTKQFGNVTKKNHTLSDITQLITHNNISHRSSDGDKNTSKSNFCKKNGSLSSVVQTPMKLNDLSSIQTNYNTPSVTIPPSTIKKANPKSYTMVQDSILLRKKQLKKVSQSDVVDEGICKSPSLNTWKMMFDTDPS